MSAALGFLGLSWALSGAAVAARLRSGDGPLGIVALVTLGPLAFGGTAVWLARAL